MEKDYTKDILNSAAILANGIINNTRTGISIYDDQEKLREIWNFTLKTVMDSIQDIMKYDDDVIYDEDWVVLKIDDSVERFILIKLLGRMDETILPSDTMIGHPFYAENPYRFINTCSVLGSELLGGQVGDSFIWINTDKNGRSTRHRVEILSIKKTEKSKKTNQFEVAADIKLYNEQENNVQKRK